MGLFSSAREKRSKEKTAKSAKGDTAAMPTTPSNRPASSSEPIQPATNPRSLRDELHALYTQRPTREAFTEHAIGLIGGVSSIKCAALLQYSERPVGFRVLVSTGFEADVLKLFAGDAGAGGWDIPLRSVRNRRINVIESAHENPFVPPALIAISPRRLTIAVVPFFHAHKPVGVAVLVSPTQRGFADALLQSLNQALRVCGAALSDLPSATAGQQPEAQEPERPQGNLLRGLKALRAELARLGEALEEAERQRAAEATERVTAQSFLQAEKTHRELLQQELESLREGHSQIPGLQEHVADLAQKLDESRRSSDSAATRIHELEQAVARGEERSAGAEQTIGELNEARRDIEKQLAAALSAAKQQEQTANALEEKLRDSISRASEADQLQKALAAAEGEHGEVHKALEQAEEAAATARQERDEIAQALEESQSSLAAAADDQKSLAKQMASLGARVEELQAAQEVAAEVQQQLTATKKERQALSDEVAKLRTRLETAARQQEEKAEESAQRVADLKAERGQLQGELQSIREQSGSSLDELREQSDAARRQLQEQFDAAEAGRQQLAREIETLRGVESERDRLNGTVSDFEEQLATARQGIEGLEARLREQSAAAERLLAERQQLEERVDGLTLGGKSLAEESRATLEAAQSRVASLESDLKNARKSLESISSNANKDLSQTRAEAEKTEQALQSQLAAAIQERDQREKALANATEEADRQRQSAAQLEAERSRLAAELDALACERNDLTALLEESDNESKKLQKQHEEGRANLAKVEEELRNTRDVVLAEANSRRENAERSHEETQAILSAERERYTAELLQLNERLEQQQAEFSEDLTTLRNETERLQQALAEKVLLLQSAEEDLTTLDIGTEEHDVDDEPLAIERSYSGDGAADVDVGPDDEGAEAEQSIAEVALLEAGEWAAETVRELIEFGHRVVSLPPNPEAASDLAGRPLACAAINLADDNSWRTLRYMRNGSGIAPAPMVAYALAPNSAKGFWLGAVDFALLPVDETDLGKMLRRMVPRMRRAIAMSNDIDIVSAVRGQLSEVGISTAVVLDGRQALDLVPTVRPEAAVLHLSPGCVDVFRTIAGLRSNEVTRDIPLLFLLDHEAEAREEAFLNAGVRTLFARGNLVPGGLTSQLASALDPYRPA